MASSLESGRKISAYPYIPVNSTTYPGKIDLETFLISYAKTTYGVKYINKNFQVPIEYIRNDFSAYVGVENLKVSYRSMISLWNGYWYNDDKTQSYLYIWDYVTERSDPDYIEDKFSVDETGITDKVFILKNAPIPMEDGYDDTYTENALYGLNDEEDETQVIAQKIVNKTYIDDRFNGSRVVDVPVKVSGTTAEATINFRPYSCYYYINQPSTGTKINSINFVTGKYDALSDINEKLVNKRLSFNLQLQDHAEYHILRDKNNEIDISVNGNSACVKFDNGFSLTSLFAESYEFYYVKCEAYLNSDGDLEIMIKSDGNYHESEVPDLDDARWIKYLKINEDTVGIPMYAYKGDLKRESFITTLEGEVNDDGIWVDESGTEVINEIKFLLTDKSLTDDDDDVVGNWAFDNDKQYTWEFFIKTPFNTNPAIIQYGVPVTWSTDAEEGIVWAMTDDPETAPSLQPNKLYCLEFTKLTNGIFIGRIKYFVSLFKKKAEV